MLVKSVNVISRLSDCVHMHCIRMAHKDELVGKHRDKNHFNTKDKESRKPQPYIDNYNC